MRRTLRRIMHWTVVVIGAAALPSIGAAPALAKYPVLSLFTGRSDGPYQPAPRRFIVVDPVPVEPTYPAGHHAGHHGAQHSGQHPTQSGAARHAAEVAASNPPLWRKQDVVTPVYPYGWFGARHGNERQVRGSYYDNYVDTNILRGR